MAEQDANLADVGIAAVLWLNARNDCLRAATVEPAKYYALARAENELASTTKRYREHPDGIALSAR